MTDQRTLKKIISEQRDEIKSLQVTYQALYDLYQEVTNKIEKFRRIAVHVVEHCCDDCEDTTMCDYGCAITKLKEALDYQQEKEKQK